MSHIALVGGTLIDGNGAEPIRDSLVLVDGTTIAYAGPARGSRSPKARRSATSPAKP